MASLHKRFKVLFLIIVTWLGGSLAAKAHEGDLSGNWERCSLSSFDNIHSLSVCDWSQTILPNSKEAGNTSTPWLIYRKTLAKMPQYCSSTGCTLVAGEVGDVAIVYLNGKEQGRHGGLPPMFSYRKNHTLTVNMPRLLVLNQGFHHQLTIATYSPKKSQVGVRAGPLGLFPDSKASSIAVTRDTFNVNVPLSLGVLCFFLGLLSVLVNGSSRLVQKLSSRPTLYMFSSSLFLISFSEVPRQFVSLDYAGPIHFLLRVLHDFSLCAVVVKLFELAEFKRWIFAKGLYVASMLLFVAGSFSSISELVGLGSFDVSYVVMRGSFLLLLLPYVMFYFSPSSRQHFYFGLALLLTTPMVVSDILVFHGMIELPYFCKFYPVFISLALFWHLVSDFHLEQAESSFVKTRNEFLENQSDLFRQISHDLRSPMAALAASLRLKGRDAARDSLQRKSVQRLHRLLGELSKKMSGKQESMYMFPVHALSEICSAKEIEAQASDIILRKNFRASTVRLCFGGNEESICRVYENILKNAFESKDGSRALVVSVSAVEVEGSLKIVFKDNGRGIAKENLEKIYDKGFTVGKAEGTGLGLAFVKEVVESFGGRLSVYSQVSHGTTVEILFPRPLEISSSFSKAMIQEDFQKVALIDDDTSIQKYFEHKLNEGYFKGFESIADFESARITSAGDWFFFVDYNFWGEKKKGTEVIADSNLLHKKNTVLLTSDFFLPEVQMFSKKTGIKVLPKKLISSMFLEKDL